MAMTFDALSFNKQPCMKELEVRQIIPREVSSFRKKAFHDFLGTLKTFTLSVCTLSVWAADDDTNRKSNTSTGYVTFISNFDVFFFDHLANVTHLDFRAHEDGPIGLETLTGDISLALYPNQMPLLESVYFENMFICLEPVHFLKAHSNTLQLISLHECCGSINGYTKSENRWEFLFTTLSNVEPRALRQVEITNESAPYQWRNESEEEVERTRKMLEEDSNKRIWPYKTLDQWNGLLRNDKHENWEAFLRGEDQRAYERLMKIVETNEC
ncbi:hypothetical protein MMC20_003033 [Loxospora ochrophaea]|nr:hypothetical protein [Loxospora ochrophaea]